MTLKDREIQDLSQRMSDITITAPSSNDDPELAKLIQIANNISPSDTLPDLEKSIDLLEKYLESRAQKKVEEDQAKIKEVERAEKLSQEREEALHPVVKKLKRASKIITSSMKKAFSLVLNVLKGGLKVLETLSFMAAELTFQTHYEVALKAILFLVTVSDVLIYFFHIIHDIDSLIYSWKLTQHRHMTVPLN